MDKDEITKKLFEEKDNNQQYSSKQFIKNESIDINTSNKSNISSSNNKMFSESNDKNQINKLNKKIKNNKDDLEINIKKQAKCKIVYEDGSI